MSTTYENVDKMLRGIAYPKIAPQNGDVLALRKQSMELTIRECECICFIFREAEVPKDVRGILTAMWRRVGKSYIINGGLPHEYSTVDILIRSKPPNCLPSDKIFLRLLRVQLAIMERNLGKKVPEEELVPLPERFLRSTDTMHINSKSIWVDLLEELIAVDPALTDKVVDVLKKENEYESNWPELKEMHPYKKRADILARIERRTAMLERLV